jgi:tol-pal system protein YbgF
MPSLMSWSRLAILTIVTPLLTLAAPVRAQQPAPPPAAKSAPGGKTQPAKPQAAQPAGDAAALRARVEQLEEQLVDLQVVIGTLESLAKSPGAGGGAPAASKEMARIQALEAQLKSLSGQIEQLGEKVRSGGEPSRRSENYVPPAAPPAGQAAEAPQAAAAAEPPAPEFQPGERLPPLGATAAAQAAPSSTESYGSSTVTSAQTGDSAGAQPGLAPVPGASAPPPAGDVAAIDPAAGGGDPKNDYEVAYSYVIQRDYGAAQAGFTDFLKRHPKDALVPNALYWLGETHYQQRNFADASEAFDLVTKIYASSPKAADSQLKRALSLSALGKTNEACAALHDLDTKFQNAPAYVRTRAGSERRRLGCT